MWTQKYAPQSSKDVLNAKGATFQLTRWLNAWTPQAAQKAVMLHGPCGIGKTTLIALIAKERGMELVDVDPTSDVATLHDTFGQSPILGTKMFQKKKTNKPLLLVIDDADAAGSMANVSTILPSSKHPLIIISSDKFASNLRSMQKHCLMCAMERAPPSEIRRCIHAICEAEGFTLYDEDIDAIAASRDIRQAILQLQLTDTPSTADEKLSPFHVTQRLFARAAPLDSHLQAMQADRDMVGLMVHENYLSHAKTVEAAGAAAAHMSDADLQAYGSAQGADACALLTVAATTPRRKPTRGSTGAAFPQFPQLLGKSSTIGKRLRLQREVMRGMGMLSSDPYTCDALLRIIGMMAKRGKDGAANAAKLAASYGLDKEAVDNLLAVCTLRKSELAGTSKAAFTRELAKLSKTKPKRSTDIVKNFAHMSIE